MVKTVVPSLSSNKRECARAAIFFRIPKNAHHECGICLTLSSNPLREFSPQDQSYNPATKEGERGSEAKLDTPLHVVTGCPACHDVKFGLPRCLFEVLSEVDSIRARTSLFGKSPPPPSSGHRVQFISVVSQCGLDVDCSERCRAACTHVLCIS